MRADETPGAGMPRHDRHQELLTPDFELTLPARAENVAVVRHAFGGIGDALEVPDHALADVKLAVPEGCTNLVVHAYPHRDRPLGLPAAPPRGGPPPCSFSPPPRATLPWASARACRTPR